jgi:TldD protein
MDPMVKNAISVLNDVASHDIFVNRHQRLSQKIVRTDAILVVFVSDGKNMTDLHLGASKNGGFEAVPISEIEIRSLVEDGKKLVVAERLKPGTYTVVTDPEWSGIIAHECFGHGMETDLYVRERALSQKYIGKPVASPIVNMFDDPSIIQEAGGFYFDDEGQLSSPTHIIKNGVLQRGLTDLASAHKLKLTRSANGRRESYARKAYARMTNTFFASGAHTKDHMIASVKNGLYLRHATNGMEDPQAWGIQVEGLWAEEIKNGKLTGTVYSPVIMTGFVPDLLKSISMVGNDGFISGLGMCGKGHKEWVKNTTSGPHLKMKARLA